MEVENSEEDATDTPPKARTVIQSVELVDKLVHGMTGGRHHTEISHQARETHISVTATGVQFKEDGAFIELTDLLVYTTPFPQSGSSGITVWFPFGQPNVVVCTWSSSIMDGAPNFVLNWRASRSFTSNRGHGGWGNQTHRHLNLHPMSKPWMTEEIREEMRKKRELQDALKSCGEESGSSILYEFREQRKKVNHLLQKAEAEWMLQNPKQAEVLLLSERGKGGRGDSIKPYGCDSCDRHYRTKAELESHLKEHVKCPWPGGCPLVAHPKILEKHIMNQHMTGLAEKLTALNTPEEISLWRSERKKWASLPEGGEEDGCKREEEEEGCMKEEEEEGCMKEEEEEGCMKEEEVEGCMKEEEEEGCMKEEEVEGCMKEEEEEGCMKEEEVEGCMKEEEEEGCMKEEEEEGCMKEEEEEGGRGRGFLTGDPEGAPVGEREFQYMKRDNERDDDEEDPDSHIDLVPFRGTLGMVLGDTDPKLRELFLVEDRTEDRNEKTEVSLEQQPESEITDSEWEDGEVRDDGNKNGRMPSSLQTLMGAYASSSPSPPPTPTPLDSKSSLASEKNQSNLHKAKDGEVESHVPERSQGRRRWGNNRRKRQRRNSTHEESLKKKPRFIPRRRTTLLEKKKVTFLQIFRLEYKT
ncbi:unnamed protein product [Darwinula stevensoni]|uniref:C2H2-type domain-containing protein n=1 Tax=Darwinula stevensoni TaxID=69355 RepID=A0A7R8WXL1_9CRUS|nr:unnamed protein product [Darwinula stevensoni]CAG0878508.1 unnamed protein product [Darwinula stevensoni]